MFSDGANSLPQSPMEQNTSTTHPFRIWSSPSIQILIMKQTATGVTPSAKSESGSNAFS
jgi:hypothetical protein